MKLCRRNFLRAAGVSLALPWLDALTPAGALAAAAKPRRRMVCINAPLGMHPAYFFPDESRQGLLAPGLPERPQGLPG